MSDSAGLHYFSRQSFPVGGAPVSDTQLEARRIAVAGRALELASGEGVFARGGLDAGSRLLLETVLAEKGVLLPSATICDLGCGWGALGCFLAAFHPRQSVVMSDINARAVWLAAFNARRNELPNAHVWCGDGLGAARNESFDMIVCNPPIRAGNATLAVLFADAHRCLKTDGALWIVIRTAQGARSWQKRLQTLFGNCGTETIESGYRVLKSIR